MEFDPHLKSDNHPDQTSRKGQRPDRLTAVCILSYIGSGAGAFAYIFYTLFYSQVKELYETKVIDIPGIDLLMSGGVRYFLTGAVLFTASFAGIWYMWRLRAFGFHIYTAAQVLLLVLPVTTLKDYPFSYIDLVLTLFFIVFYRFHLKFMN